VPRDKRDHARKDRRNARHRHRQAPDRRLGRAPGSGRGQAEGQRAARDPGASRHPCVSGFGSLIATWTPMYGHAAIDCKRWRVAMQRISYVSPETVADPKMREEFERCRREGTPRPESQAIRAHVPATFWSFANTWRDVFHGG